MPRCAFLSTDGLDGFVVDDHLAHAPLEALGWDVVTVPWRRPTDWDRFDAVVLRSTWDYPDHLDAFVAVLRQVEASSALLLNPLPLVEWNLHKTYLGDLAARGVPVVPSTWGSGPPDLGALFVRLDTDRLVVKPVVGANAVDTFPVGREAGDTGPVGRDAGDPGRGVLTVAEAAPRLARAFAHREWLAQPFLDTVVEEGERSLFFFDGHFSHAVHKRPAPGDFRVQEEHGARIEPLVPEPRLRRAATRVLSVLPAVPLYARVDLVRLRGGWGVMELELVEPSLYLRMDPGAPERFARAIHRRASAPQPPASAR